jgi:hypothetical protein
MANTDPSWLLLVLTLPTSNTAGRMRAWRALKAMGCATLRDGVYLLPFQTEIDYQLRKLAREVRQEGGQSWVLTVDEQSASGEAGFTALFDRTAPYAQLCRSVDAAMAALPGQPPLDTARMLRKLRKDLDALRAIDYFPSEPGAEAEASWLRFAQAAEAAMSPGEPGALAGEVPLLNRDDYQGRRWATRKRLWVDRVASAWLIKRFIDVDAKFVWLDTPAASPADVVGFDYDAATFSHVGELVTFEVLLASFDLASDPALRRLGALVHHLDIGGGYVPEAVGFEAMMHGARKRGLNDTRLLAEMSAVLDSLYAHFSALDDDTTE